MRAVMKTLIVCLIVGLSVGVAHAEIVTSLPDGTVVPIPLVHYGGCDAQTVASGITWTSTVCANPPALFGSSFGDNNIYGFGANGFWKGSAGIGPWPALNSSLGTMTVTFANPVGAVGGFINYFPDAPAGPGGATISPWVV